MKVYPLSATLPDWSMFQKIGNECFSFDPIREIDSKRLDKQDPHTFCSLMNFNTGKDIGAHFYISFIINYDYDDLTYELFEYTNVKVTQLDTYNALITGNLNEWSLDIAYFCSTNVDIRNRKIFNSIFDLFTCTRLKFIWDSYSRKLLEDETFILE